MAEASLMGSRDAKNWPVEGCRPERCTPAGRPPVSRDVRSGEETKKRKNVTPGAKAHSVTGIVFKSGETPLHPRLWAPKCTSLTPTSTQRVPQNEPKRSHLLAEARQRSLRASHRPDHPLPRYPQAAALHLFRESGGPPRLCLPIPLGWDCTRNQIKGRESVPQKGFPCQPTQLASSLRFSVCLSLVLSLSAYNPREIMVILANIYTNHCFL